MPFINYDGILFNKEWVASKTFKEFSEHEKHHGLSVEKMKEVYALCTGKKAEPPKQADVTE